MHATPSHIAQALLPQPTAVLAPVNTMSAPSAAVHVPLAPQIPLAQSPGSEHFFPMHKPTHTPPQSTPSSSPSWTPFAQVWEAGLLIPATRAQPWFTASQDSKREAAIVR